MFSVKYQSSYKYYEEWETEETERKQNGAKELLKEISRELLECWENRKYQLILG